MNVCADNDCGLCRYWLYLSQTRNLQIELLAVPLLLVLQFGMWSHFLTHRLSTVLSLDWKCFTQTHSLLAQPVVDSTSDSTKLYGAIEILHCRCCCYGKNSTLCSSEAHYNFPIYSFKARKHTNHFYNKLHINGLINASFWQVYLCCRLPPANDYTSHLQNATTVNWKLLK